MELFGQCVAGESAPFLQTSSSFKAWLQREAYVPFIETVYELT